MCFRWGGVARVPVVMGDSGTSKLAWPASPASPSAGVNYCPSCGKLFHFSQKSNGCQCRVAACQLESRLHVTTAHSITTAYKQNMLAAALQQARATAKVTTKMHRAAVPVRGCRIYCGSPISNVKRGKNTGVARRQGTVVKRTFASYGVPTTKSKQKRTRTERKVLKEQTPARATRREGVNDSLRMTRPLRGSWKRSLSSSAGQRS